MDVESYKRQREVLARDEPKYRSLCIQCLQPEFGCYCAHVRKFDAKIKFVILIHPIERKRRIASGRMAHLCLENSELIIGQDYSENAEVNGILQNPLYQPMLLYPGAQSLNLSQLSEERKSTLFSTARTPVIFVVDGTWATARKTVRLSQNLRTVPRLCFTPTEQSRFRVRKQPGVNCYSTLEAIHHTIELVGKHVGFNTSSGEHHGLLSVFDIMVERQLEFIRAARAKNLAPYRRPRTRVA